jgi:hypothetical protein
MAMPAKKADFFGAALKASTKAPKAMKAMTTQAVLATEAAATTEVSGSYE